MDDGFGDFLGVATVLVIGGALVPMFTDAVFFGGASVLPLLVMGAVVWILWHVYSGLS